MIFYLFFLGGRSLAGISFNNQRFVGLYFMRDVTFYFRESILSREI